MNPTRSCKKASEADSGSILTFSFLNLIFAVTYSVPAIIILADPIQDAGNGKTK